MIPFLDLKRQYNNIKTEINNEILDTLASQMFILGEELKKFEKKVAEYLGVKYALGVASGTDALLLSLKALDIKPGDKVATSPFTFIATAETIVEVGAIPVFVDIGQDFNIDPVKLEEVLKDNNIKAIIPVHLFGNPCNMEKIMQLAEEYDYKVIEDCAQAIGSEINNKKVGSFGVGCFSFFPAKNLGCFGDGGLVTTNSDETYKKLILLRNHGSSPEDKYSHLIIGKSSRLDTLQARILSIKLDHLDKWNADRINNANFYIEKIEDKNILPVIDTQGKHVFNQFTLRTKNRDKLKAFLERKDIPTMIYYPRPLHLQPCFKFLNHKEGDFPEAEAACKEVLSIPIFPELTLTEKEEIVKNINEFGK